MQSKTSQNFKENNSIQNGVRFKSIQNGVRFNSSQNDVGFNSSQNGDGNEKFLNIHCKYSEYPKICHTDRDSFLRRQTKSGLVTTLSNKFNVNRQIPDSWAAKWRVNSNCDLLNTKENKGSYNRAFTCEQEEQLAKKLM